MSYELDHIETLIARDIANSLSPEEKATLQEWLAADPANRQYYDALMQTWSLAGEADVDFAPATERNWALFQQKITPAPVKRSLLYTYRHALRIAAGIVLLGGAATAYFTLLYQPDIMVLTQAREKKTVTLPDGSKVFLNQQSKLTYAAGFKGTERAVHLEGEAFFEVTQHAEQPFVVYASHTRTQVLGTSFDIKHYADDQVEVSVVTGKVAFTTSHDQQQRLVLNKGDKGVLQSSKTLRQTTIEDPNFMAWKENRLSFQDTQISDVIRTLQEYFNVRITLTDTQMARLRYNGTFDPEQLGNVEAVLEVICPTVNLSWHKDADGAYILSPAQPQ